MSSTSSKPKRKMIGDYVYRYDWNGSDDNGDKQSNLTGSYQWAMSEKLLGVRYVPAPFGDTMIGESSHTAYKNLLHQPQLDSDGPMIGANIKVPRSSSMDVYKDILSVLDMDVSDAEMPSLLKYLSRTSQCRAPKSATTPESQSKSQLKRRAAAVVVRSPKTVAIDILGRLHQCQETIRHEQDKEMRERSYDSKEKILSYHQMISFIESVRNMLLRVNSSGNWYLNEDSFPQLVQEFALIFQMKLCLPDLFSNATLIVAGERVPARPDLICWRPSYLSPSLIIVTIAETKPMTPPSHEHKLRQKHRHDESDTKELPDSLRGQHACQLVYALPFSCMPNKDCILGLIVQATQVRLSCLVMEEEHRKQIEKEGFKPENMATIYYTRAYSMLSKQDRKHLMYIFCTLANVQ